MVDAVLLIGRALSYCVEMVTSIFDRLGALPIYYAAVLVFFACRFLLRPILGGGSDKAKSRKGDDE